MRKRRYIVVLEPRSSLQCFIGRMRGIWPTKTYKRDEAHVFTNKRKAEQAARMQSYYWTVTDITDEAVK